MNATRLPVSASRRGTGHRIAALLALAALAPWMNVWAMPILAPGSTLDVLLTSNPVQAARYGLDGAPPGPPGALPRAPDLPGRHWLVVYDPEGNPSDWHRFQIGEETPGASPVHTRVLVDDRAPSVSLRWQDAGPQRDQAQVAGPAAQPGLAADDPSHVAELQLFVDGQAVGDPTDWSEGLDEGRYAVGVRSRDRLDNSAIQPQPDVWLDRTAPTVRWERIDAQPGIADDIFDGSPIRIRLLGEDAVAGVRSLRANATTGEGAQLDIATDQAEVHWQAEDRAGNIASGILALRLDREGPQLRIRRGDDDLPPPWRLRTSDSVILEAVDPLAGVAHACVESSIWRGDCRSLPITLSGIDPGRYVLRLRGADRLGNRSNSRNEIEVSP